MRLMDLDHYKTIFIGEFDSELLIKIMETFKGQVIEIEAFNNETEQRFIYEFLSMITATPNFDFTLDFLGKKEKELISIVLNNLSLLPDELKNELITKFKL